MCKLRDQVNVDEDKQVRRINIYQFVWQKHEQP